MTAILNWWDGVELWLTGLPFVVQTAVVMPVVLALAYGSAVVLDGATVATLPWRTTQWTAGALAAALSTADGLLLTIANALSHDVYYHMIDRQASHQRRVTTAKVVLLGVADLALVVIATKLAGARLIIMVKGAGGRKCGQ